MVSGCLAPITQKAFIRQGAWSFLGWWLDRRYVQDRGNLEPQQYPRKIFRYEPVCLRWSQVVGRLVVNFYPSLWPFCDFHIYGDCFFWETWRLYQGRCKESSILVPGFRDVQVGNFNFRCQPEKEGRCFFSKGRWSCWPKKTWRVTSCLWLFLDALFWECFFQLYHMTVWLWLVASRWSSEAFEHVAIGHSSHREIAAPEVASWPNKGKFRTNQQ